MGEATTRREHPACKGLELGSVHILGFKPHADSTVRSVTTRPQVREPGKGPTVKLTTASREYEKPNGQSDGRRFLVTSSRCCHPQEQTGKEQMCAIKKMEVQNRT